MVPGHKTVIFGDGTVEVGTEYEDLDGLIQTQAIHYIILIRLNCVSFSLLKPRCSPYTWWLCSDKEGAVLLKSHLLAENLTGAPGHLNGSTPG